MRVTPGDQSFRGIPHFYGDPTSSYGNDLKKIAILTLARAVEE